MPPLVDGWDLGSWSVVYSALSFGIVWMGSASIFFWLQLANVSKKFRTSFAITGLVTFIAIYQYLRICNTWYDAFDVKFSAKEGYYVVCLTSEPFNVPTSMSTGFSQSLRLIGLILVTGLPAERIFFWIQLANVSKKYRTAHHHRPGDLHCYLLVFPHPQHLE